MAKSNLLALDKTGTLTEGKPSVVKAELSKDFDASLLYALVGTSNHPISKGILKYLKKEYDSLQTLELKNIKSIEAKGLEATYENKELLGGNSLLLKDKGIEFNLESENSLFVFAINSEVKASFELRDNIREGTKELVEEVQKMGIEVVMLTGDHDLSAKRVAKEVGIKEVHSRLLPQDKSALIEKFQKDNKVVVMVGDGINDSIALAQSNIAIAMGGGADVAISVSDVVLLDEKPLSILEAFQISRRTYGAVKENLAFSLLYNLIAVPLAVAGFVTPLIAALSMSISSLVVVGNSMRIKSIKFKK
jgi:Cu+-exporting ATPase